jgi:hypothetical protein
MNEKKLFEETCHLKKKFRTLFVCTISDSTRSLKVQYICIYKYGIP